MPARCFAKVVFQVFAIFISNVSELLNKVQNEAAHQLYPREALKYGSAMLYSSHFALLIHHFH